MIYGYKNARCVVTGGSSGIGFETARLLINEGANVVICGRNLDSLQKAKAELGDKLEIFQCDVTIELQVKAFAAFVEKTLGGCDLLVTNAGQGRVSTFENTDDAAWHEELTLKFFSQIYPIRAFKPLLDKSENAAIVAVNSLLAYQPEAHMVATSAARAGVQNLIKSMAGEFAPNIRVNSIVLGLVDSAQWQKRFDAREDKAISRDVWYADLASKKGIPLQRLGKPHEAAHAILFLGSNAASYITGAVLEVSGGVRKAA
jgi:NAD(P)-dependent dehydrogenase (short-subunit alcohol dehydrogenase family)